MTNKSKRILTVILGILLGATLSGLFCAVVWYLIGYRFPLHEFLGDMTILYGLIGLLLGGSGGSIIGLIITSLRLGKVVSIIVGFVVNGLFPWFVALVLDGSNNAPLHDVERLWNYSSIGQAIVGGVVGLIIAVFCNYMKPNPSDDLP